MNTLQKYSTPAWLIASGVSLFIGILVTAAISQYSLFVPEDHLVVFLTTALLITFLIMTPVHMLFRPKAWEPIFQYVRKIPPKTFIRLAVYTSTLLAFGTLIAGIVTHLSFATIGISMVSIVFLNAWIAGAMLALADWMALAIDNVSEL